VCNKKWREVQALSLKEGREVGAEAKYSAKIVLSPQTPPGLSIFICRAHIGHQ
jgi:hypothetical protein